MSGPTRAVTPQAESIDARVLGATRIVVATVRDITAEWRENQWGDRLIVSRVALEISETLKGDVTETTWMDLEGGTRDGLTLRVSSLPVLEVGERALFFLAPASRGIYVPYMRGEGILSIDEHDVVRGSTLRLDDIRSRARSLGR